MFDIGWSEMGIIALVTLVVMGPKELPNALRTFSTWMKQLRGMAREFQSGVDQLIREAELEDARKKLQEASTLNINREIEKVIDPDRALQTALAAPAVVSKPAETKPAETKPIEPQSIESKPAEPAPEATGAPAATAEVKTFPLAASPAPAGINGAAPHINGADPGDSGVASVTAPVSASPGETNDDPGISVSRKAHG